MNRRKIAASPDKQPEGGPQAPAHDAPRGRCALLIVDMINCFDFPGADVLQPKAIAIAQAICALKATIVAAGESVIYVNDNFGEWHSEKSLLVERALSRPNPVADLLQPSDTDFFIIKPQYSGFYATNLPVLLPKLGVDRIILTGIATDICILFTAADAHMRDYRLWIPQDCVAAESDEFGHFALKTMHATMDAEIAATSATSFADWNKRFRQLKSADQPG